MTITLNGREYPLRFSVNALCCLEEKEGVSLSELQGAPLRCLRGLLWCALMDACPGQTIEQAGELLDAHLKGGGELSKVSADLAAALEDACFFPRRDRRQTAPPSP